MNQAAELFASPNELAEQEARAVEEDQVNLKTFLKEAGEESQKPQDKLTLKKKDLEGKEADVVVLEPVA